MERRLWEARERPELYSKFNVKELYRGEMQSRAAFYTQRLQNGGWNSNEVRQKEDMNPTEGGDTHVVQVNQIALDRLGAYSDKLSTERHPC